MKSFDSDSGFTLIEIMIAMAIGTIIIGAAIGAFFSLQKASSSIDQRSTTAVTARGAIYVIEENIRLLGFNPEQNLSTGNIMDNGCALNGLLRFNRSNLEDPANNPVDTVSIGLNSTEDSDRDGFADNGATSLVIGGNIADDIAVLKFAYAFDSNRDGNVELSSNGNIRWAIDSNGDEKFDTELDTNDDGKIDINDTVGGSSMSPVDIEHLRAVKVWLVVRSKYPIKGHTEPRTFVVGDQRYTPNDNYGYSLLTTTIRCRNMFN